MGFNAGMDSAFKLTGLTFGARHKSVIAKTISAQCRWKPGEGKQAVEGTSK